LFSERLFLGLAICVKLDFLPSADR